MKFGVIIPSRLALRPGGCVLEDHGPELWLDGAVASVLGQRGFNANDWEIYVGVDPLAVVPGRFYDHVTVVQAPRPGQASSVNAAADLAVLHADVLMILEDDDRWRPEKTEVQLGHLGDAAFVSCSQRLFDVSGNDTGNVVHYPSPSGWLMTAALWGLLRGLDSSYRWLLDIEWLGRLNQSRRRRVHVTSNQIQAGYGLVEVSHYAAVATYESPNFLVERTVNPKGGMMMVQSNAEAEREAREEEARIRKAFGYMPW